MQVMYYQPKIAGSHARLYNTISKDIDFIPEIDRIPVDYRFIWWLIQRWEKCPINLKIIMTRFTRLVVPHTVITIMARLHMLYLPMVTGWSIHLKPDF